MNNIVKILDIYTQTSLILKSQITIFFINHHIETEIFLISFP